MGIAVGDRGAPRTTRREALQELDDLALRIGRRARTTGMGEIGAQGARRSQVKSGDCVNGSVNKKENSLKSWNPPPRPVSNR